MQTVVPVRVSRPAIFLAGLLLVFAGLAAYSNSFRGPFILDDLTSINHNESIQHGWREVFNPPVGGETVMGRPLINLSLALNYWRGGLNPQGYHFANLAIHLLGGLTLFGLLRRTLERPVLRAKFGKSSVSLAFVIALLWVVHPLQTESVSYIVQRAESLVSLFYLLTLYFFVRGVESARSWTWLGLSFAACLLGVFSKEVIATAPLLVLLYDRTFVAGTFKEAWRQRRGYYFALAGTWIPLGWLIVQAQGHFAATAMMAPPAGAAALSPGMLWWGYLLKQCEAIVHYLWLAFWPHPLVIDYGAGLILNPLEVAPQAVVLILLFAATLWALVRRPALGFLGAWFFLILAPSSSIVPLLNNTIYEHRVYLPLAAVLAFVVMGLWLLAGWRIFPVILLLAVGLGSLTFARNRDYDSDFRMKLNLLVNEPDYSRAHQYVGYLLVRAGRLPEGLRECEAALRMKPDDATGESLLGFILESLGRNEEAIIHYQRALQIDPQLIEAHNNLAGALNALGRWPEAQKEYRRSVELHPESAFMHFNYGVSLLNHDAAAEAARELETALRLQPDFAEAHLNYGVALLGLGLTREALDHFEESLRLKPEGALAHKDIGYVLMQNGQADRALPHFREAARLTPNDPEMHFLLGNAFLGLGQLEPAEKEFRRALQLRPEYFEAENNLGNALLAQNRLGDALAAYAQVVKWKPDNAPAQFNYGNVLARAGRMAEAVAYYQEAIRLQPDYPEAHNDLGSVLAALGRLPEAVTQYQEALRLKPDYADARKNLEAVSKPQ